MLTKSLLQTLREERHKISIRMANNLFMPFSLSQNRSLQVIGGLHIRARLLGARIRTDNQGWSKMAKGKGPKPI